MRGEQLIEFEYFPAISGWNLPHLPMRVAYEPVKLEEMRAVGFDVQSRDRRRVRARARDDTRGSAQMGMNDVGTKFMNASLDRRLCEQPSRDRRYLHPIRYGIDNRCAEPTPMLAPHDEHDVVVGCLKAREFRSVALGSGEAAGKDDVHNVHISWGYREFQAVYFKRRMARAAPFWQKNMKVPLLKRLSRQMRGRWRAKVLAAHGIAVVADTKNGLLAVQPGDFNVSRSVLNKGEYDWPQIELLAGLVTASSRLIFAGAHIGALLVPIVRAAGTRAVIAYEPSPRNFRLLNMNLALNEIDGIVLMNSAIGESPGRIRFTENQINTGNSRVDMSHGALEVPVDTLDRTVPPEWESIDLIVMDIEGSEVAAMRGAQAVLARTRRLYVEFAPEQLREQGSTSEEFMALAARFFKSAYVVDGRMQFVRAAEFSAHLLPLSKRRGLLLNLLLTQDTDASAAPRFLKSSRQI